MEYIWLVPAFPLLGVIINGLFGRTYIRERAHYVAVPAAGLSFIVALLISRQVFAGQTLDVSLYPWVVSGDFEVPFGFLVDPLSTVMMLTVTFVGLLIHIYSIGYMHDDPGYPRFFAYLNLFMFSMLMLILANNYLLMFLGWEGVGLCSYLLIGFWYEKKTATDAGNKAFIVNRVGDAGFLLGLFLIWTTFGTLQYGEVFHQAEGLHGVLTAPAGGGLSVVTWITLALFIGAIGKSAQLPLYVWLPDAMEGPTPVSALIHAATMVTAGIYMVARSSPLYTLAPFSLAVVAWVGALTAIFAATIACVQNDIKRVIAYSTISQLGYMFLGVGVGAFASGIFHLYTHAAFKALLFLGAGAVIHALHHEQDIQRMGGLRPHMRVTAYTFAVGALANAGIFPFAGFWSKDEILFAAFNGGFYVLWFLGLAGAFLTGFYMARLYFLTFEGEYRGDPHHAHDIHDAPPTMGIPLIVLAVCSVVAGFVGIPPEQGPFHQFLAPVLHHGGAAQAAAHGLAVPMAVLSLLVAGAGIGVGYLFYVSVSWRNVPEIWAARLQGLYRVVYHKYYVDELFWAIFGDGFLGLSRFTSQVDEKVVDGAVNGTAAVTLGLSTGSDWGDMNIVDGLVNKIADVIQGGSRRLRLIQTGVVQNYILAIAIGIFLIAGVYIIL
ncbi:MAG: NADH-quinone oxidoreductase subunit L [candidate division NC10 bacterium]|nr:NADH-quinone oxidoreductase subunit L [candidate division NC10 bacterium]